MKKLILVAMIAMSAIACKKDEIVEPVKPTTCEIWSQKQTRTFGIGIAMTQWSNVGDPKFHSNNCSDAGKILPGSTLNNHNGTTVELRYLLYKK